MTGSLMKNKFAADKRRLTPMTIQDQRRTLFPVIDARICVYLRLSAVSLS